jgi:uncharacterized protein YgiM (DUF1202 family)
MMTSRKWNVTLALLCVLLFVIAGQSAYAAVESQQAQFAIPKLVVNASFLNIRTGPGVEYTVLVTVVGGTELPVIGRASDNVWFQVTTVAGVGWVNVQFTLPRGSFDNVPTVAPPEVIAPLSSSGAVTLGLIDGQGGGDVSTTPAVGTSTQIQLDTNQVITVSRGERFRAVIIVEAVNLRSQPFDGAPVLTTLYKATSTIDYSILGYETDKRAIAWIAIDVPGIGVGWIEATHAFFRLSRLSGTVVVVREGEFRLTSTPGGSSDGKPLVRAGDEGFLKNISPDSQFVAIELGDGTMGWVPFSAVFTRTDTPTDQIDLEQFAIGNVTSSQDMDAGGGSSLVTDGPHVVVNTGFLNIRSGPGAQFSTITTVPGGTRLRTEGITRDGFWFMVSGSFGSGWVNSEYVLFRGVISTVPVVTSEIGRLGSVVAVVEGVVTLYAAPGNNFGVIGSIQGPVELAVVARTSDGVWLQVNSPLGFGWLVAGQVPVRGDLSVVPVIY